jgi:hypothetical protein
LCLQCIYIKYAMAFDQILRWFVILAVCKGTISFT